MGRSRIEPASSSASCDRRAALARLIEEIDQQDGVLDHQAHQHDEADGAEDVERRAGDQQPEEHADQRHRQRHHDGDRLQEAAELRGQDQVDQDHRQQQRLAGIGRALGMSLVEPPNTKR